MSPQYVCITLHYQPLSLNTVSPFPFPHNAGTDVLDDLHKQSNKPGNFLQVMSVISGVKCQGHPSDGSWDTAENIHGSSSTGHIIIDPTILTILRSKPNSVECECKIPPLQSYTNPRRHKALQIKKHKLLMDRSQTYILLSAWRSCAGRHCQDNINIEMEIEWK